MYVNKTNLKIYALKYAKMSNQALNEAREKLGQGLLELSIEELVQFEPGSRQEAIINAYRAINMEGLEQAFSKFDSFSIFDEVYPKLLKEIHNPPMLLFYQGNID